MQEKMKHLELTQNVITRLANNSFQVKKWCLAVIGAIWAVTLKEDQGTFKHLLGLIALIISFWYLSSYYLQQERLFRKIYDYIVFHDFSTDGPSTPRRFNLTPKHYDFKPDCIPEVMFSRSQAWFFIPLIIVNLFVHSYLIPSDWCMCCGCNTSTHTEQQATATCPCNK